MIVLGLTRHDVLETSTLTFTSTITFGLPFMVLDLVYKFKMIGIRELVIKWKPSVGLTDIRTWVKLNFNDFFI